MIAARAARWSAPNAPVWSKAYASPPANTPRTGIRHLLLCGRLSMSASLVLLGYFTNERKPSGRRGGSSLLQSRERHPRPVQSSRGHSRSGAARRFSPRCRSTPARPTSDRERPASNENGQNRDSADCLSPSHTAQSLDEGRALRRDVSLIQRRRWPLASLLAPSRHYQRSP